MLRRALFEALHNTLGHITNEHVRYRISPHHDSTMIALAPLQIKQQLASEDSQGCHATTPRHIL